MKVNSHKLNDPDYPGILAQIYDPPPIIYWTGTNPLSWLTKPRLGIVGSRKPTTYGRQVAHKLSYEAASSDIVIISGLAFGIDSIAHQAALEAAGLTVAILPGPLDRIYPASHRQLAKSIITSGGTLISEYLSGTDIRKENFIARNRIIAGLSEALLVPQAASHSGSLHTAGFALEQGKTVMAVPAEITSLMHAGSNNLLKSGALMVTEVNDIFSAMGLTPINKSPKRLIKATPAQRVLFDLIGNGTRDQEALVAASNLPSGEVSSALSLLEIEGLVRANGGRWSVT